MAHTDTRIVSKELTIADIAVIAVRVSGVMARVMVNFVVNDVDLVTYEPLLARYVYLYRTRSPEDSL